MSAPVRRPRRGPELVRLGLSMLVIVLIAVLIILNLGNITTFNLFGWTIRNLNVVAVAIGGFLVGVVYAFIYHVIATVGRSRRERLQEREQVVRKREQELARGKDDGDSRPAPGRG